MRILSRLMSLLGVILLAGLQTGCATQKLWENNADKSYYQPATEAKARFFRTLDDQKVLVQYEETKEDGAKAKRRVYFLEDNILRVEANKRPRFLSESDVAKVAGNELSLVTGTNAPPPGITNYIRMDEGSFWVAREGKEAGPYHLPDYPSAGRTAGRVALTPLAVTFDATVFGEWAFLMSLGGYK